MIYRPISVILPVYKKTKFKDFLKSINSITFSQKFLSKEIILLVDGPIDKRILCYYINLKKIFFTCKFKIIKFSTNKGLGIVLNYGVKQASYDLILRCDSDDFSDQNRIKYLYEYYLKNKKFSVIDTSLKENINNLTYYRNFNNKQKNSPFSFKLRNRINHPTTLIKKKDVLKVGNYENVPFFEDYFLWIKMMKQKYLFSNINLPLVNTNIDNNFLNRRSGKNYLKSYVFFLNKCLKIRFINKLEFYLLIFLRYFILINDKKFINFFYKNFLRKKK